MRPKGLQEVWLLMKGLKFVLGFACARYKKLNPFCTLLVRHFCPVNPEGFILFYRPLGSIHTSNVGYIKPQKCRANKTLETCSGSAYLLSRDLIGEPIGLYKQKPTTKRVPLTQQWRFNKAFPLCLSITLAQRAIWVAKPRKYKYGYTEQKHTFA